MNMPDRCKIPDFLSGMQEEMRNKDKTRHNSIVVIADIHL